MTPQFFKLANGCYQLVYEGQPAPEGATACTEAEFSAATNPAPTAHDLLAPQAQAALDIVTGARGQLARCGAAGIAFPATWQAYVVALRNIVNDADTTSTALPSQPAYVVGT